MRIFPRSVIDSPWTVWAHPVGALALSLVTEAIANIPRTHAERAYIAADSLSLYRSHVNADFAFLPAPPSQFCPTIANPESYKVVPNSTVGLVPQNVSTAQALYAYWSADRKDVQTTEWDLATLNKHGGNYTLLNLVGFVVTDPLSLVTGTQVPLQLAYSTDRQDGLSSALNHADANALCANATEKAGFRESRHSLGYARSIQANEGPLCLSKTWPTGGGPDCARECGYAEKVGTTTYRLSELSGAAVDAFSQNVAAASKVLKSLGGASTNTGSKLHISLNYLCCYSRSELGRIKAALTTNFTWPALNVSFSRPVWRVDKPAGGHTSLIVRFNESLT